jgi:hypothetical protein
MTDPRFTTVFDEPSVPSTLPVAVDSGTDLAVQLADGLFRGDGLVGRVTHPDAMLGVRVTVPAGARSVRVGLTLSVDDASPRWWDERVPSEARPRGAHTPRLIRILSQGESRLVTMLRRTASDRGRPTSTVVSFDLAAGEIEPGGLLVIELRSLSGGLASWAHVLPYGAVGVRVDRIDVVPQPSAAEPRIGHLAGGSHPVVRRRTAEIDVRPGFFVANPGPAATPVWTLRAVLKVPERPRSYRRHPWRQQARRKVARIAKEVLPARSLPTVRRGIQWYRGTRTELRSRPAPAIAPVAAPRRQAVVLPVVRHTGPAARLVAARRVRAEACDLGAGTPVAVRVTTGRGLVRIRPEQPLTGPVLVRVETAPLIGWRLSVP